jgi:pSer/pThr/pTyr-binding forkhead associated (FHA) protein
MFDHVILSGIEGGLTGQKFVLENETSYILGRSPDCSIRIPATSYLVSRRHCRISVSARSVHIQDLGSLNGTYVNGEKIGQRGKSRSFEEALQEQHAEYPLWDGDILRIGNNIFQVEFAPPPPCAAAESRDQEKLWTSDHASCC